ncbi:MAG: PglD-related sugar-binding protein, partial [Phycisphaerales bacterium]
MPSPHIILIGAGGHAKVVLETAQAANIPIKGYLDDNPNPPITSIPNHPPAVGTIEDITPAGISSASQPFLAIGNLE